MTEATTNFKKLNLDQAILDNLVALGYTTMTPVQAKSLPFILNQQDIIAQANTGSGKTAAFALGILVKLNLNSLKPQAIVVVPTRELAEQVSNEIRRLARYSNKIKVITLAGGSDERHKLKSLEQGAHVVVGTAGRLIKFLDKGTLDASAVQTLVLDEADRLLELGNIEDINQIASHTSLKRQTMLFSATFPNGIKKLSEEIQENAEQVTIDSQHQLSTVQQYFFKVQEEKEPALIRLLAHYKPESCIIFCNSREVCNKVTKQLRRHRMESLHIHSDLEQADRTLTLIKFENRSCRILVATDLASRGLDIKDVSAVINYDLPRDHELYVHRIGRTGRAGQKGLALSLYFNREAERLRDISEYLKKPCHVVKLDSVAHSRTVALPASMATMYISGGKKNNLRPGDILGALTKEAGLKGDQVGKIHVLDVNSYVAVTTDQIANAVEALGKGKIKGKKFKVGRA